MSIKKNELKESKSKSMLERSYKVPDTYVIIFFVVLLAAVLTYVVPQGYFETKDVTYMVDGEEKTRTVVDSETFQYVLDDSGQKVTNGVKFFEPYGEVGF
ncbi:C4-dicarboxylate anaerobic carrier (fragment) [Acetoanaerobium sticklandii]|uniref:C4-dicarboxylate anaerobic carrier n=2 Tax=Acetoanaerobium TaxID=186831 RepID=E3PWH3_ACESD